MRSTAHRSRRLAALVGVVVIVATSCADDDGTTAPTTAASDPVTATTAPADDPPPTIVAPTDTATDTTIDTTVPAGPRTVDHAAGTTEVPANPERVVVLDAGTTLPTLLDLGVTVVAAPLPPDPIDTALLDAGDLAGIESIGFPEFDLEAVFRVEPDVIIGFDEPAAMDRYGELSSIAPTVLIESTLSDWKAQSAAIADAVGESDRFAADLDDFDAAAASLADDLGDPSAIEISVVRALGDQFRIHTVYHFAGQIIEQVGLSRPDTQRAADEDERLVQLSLEEIERADADVIYVYGAGSQGSAGDGVDAAVEQLRQNGLWDRLGAVEAGAVHVVDPLAWQQGGLPAARIVLDDLRRTLLGT